MKRFSLQKCWKESKKILKPCEICQRFKHLTIRYDVLVQPILVNKPNEILLIDFYGAFSTTVGRIKYILSTIDDFSKYVIIYKIKKANTLAVINKIFKDYIIKFGKPIAIMTDHGTQFTSKKWTDKLVDNGIKPIFSSVRHPQSNMVERIHRELCRYFRVYMQHAHKGWAKYTEKIMKIRNETHHDTTGDTPLELHFNKKPTRVWEKYMKVQNTDNTPYERRLFLARERVHGQVQTRANKKHKNRIHKE